MKLAPFLLCLLLLSGCASPTAPPEAAAPSPVASNTPDGFDRAAMLQALVANVILPAHEAFAQEATALDTAVAAFVAQPDAAGLGAAQAQWERTSLAFASLTWYNLGPIQDAVLHNPINKWPADEAWITEAIAGGEVLDVAFIEGAGSPSKGLAALSYLLFPDQGDDAAVLAAFADPVTGARRGQYLGALATTLHRHADALLAAWSPNGGNYAADFAAAASDGGELQGSISMVTNRMIASLEDIIEMDLYLPLWCSQPDTACPQQIQMEGYRSRTTLASIEAALVALQTTFNGAGPQEPQGLADYLDFLGARYGEESLSVAINAQLDRTLGAMRAIEQPLQPGAVEDIEAVRLVYNEAKALLVLLKADMASQLGVTVTFSDNDGD